MLFGDPSNFAIEVMAEPELVAPSTVWGRMCIHIGEVILGDYNDPHCGLYDAYCEFGWHLNRVEPLWDQAFDGLSLEQIHDTVANAIYGDDDRTNEQIQQDSIRYRHFDFLTNWGEQFDGYSSVIVASNDETITILHRPYSDNPRRRIETEFVVAECTRTGFIDTVRQFVYWFDAETKRLTSSK